MSILAHASHEYVTRSRKAPRRSAIRPVDIDGYVEVSERFAADVGQRHPPEPPIIPTFTQDHRHSLEIAVSKLDVGKSNPIRPADQPGRQGLETFLPFFPRRGEADALLSAAEQSPAWG